MKIYRIEHKLTGVGPIAYLSGYTGVYDGDMLYGCISVADLDKWFSRKARIRLHDSQPLFVFRTYEVPTALVVQLETQEVRFMKTSDAILIRTKRLNRWLV